LRQAVGDPCANAHQDAAPGVRHSYCHPNYGLAGATFSDATGYQGSGAGRN